MKKVLRAIKIAFALAALLVVVGGFLGYRWFTQGTAPMPNGPSTYIRFERPTKLAVVYEQLRQMGIVRDVQAWLFAAKMVRIPETIGAGTYEVRPGMGPSQVYVAFERPIRRMVRLPETNWAQRTANLLEQKYQIGPASEYMKLVRDPQQFAGEVSFPLPTGSLEGYLYPDTYDLPPLMPVRQVILRQLRAFESKVWEGLDRPTDLSTVLTKASMVELETGTDYDRAIIAGEINNRLKAKMRLQIDATILYGMQEWRNLTRRDYREQKNPYNTYLIDGLPPGPICSPSLASIRAVMNPAQHDYLYHVALPNGSSLFSSTYKGHLKNIEKRHAAMGVTP